MDTTAHNIANAHTEGFSRQSIDLEQREPVRKLGLLIGNGVRVNSIRRAYDGFVDRQLNKVKSSFGQSQARQESISEVEGIFSPELSTTISQELDGFFSALQTLSNFPEELTARTSVRERGRSLATAFNRIDYELNRVRNNLNEKIEVQTSQVNTLVENIAKLNAKINGTESDADSPANDLHDQRDRLVRELSDLISLNYYNDEYGMVTVRGPNDVLLVEGPRFAEFRVASDADNDALFAVQAVEPGTTHFRDITSAIVGGRMGGTLEVRDQTVGQLLKQNNAMAWRFIQEFNGVHRDGYGLGDFRLKAGRDFFKPVEDFSLAAREMQLSDVIANSTDAISAGSLPDTPGDNVNLNKLIDIKAKPVFEEGDATFTEFYSNFVGVLGIQALRANHILESDKVLEAEWSGRRESVSGVSLDEEAANLIRWQTAFTASSKVITTVDEMLETVLTLKR